MKPRRVRMRLTANRKEDPKRTTETVKWILESCVETERKPDGTVITRETRSANLEVPFEVANEQLETRVNRTVGEHLKQLQDRQDPPPRAREKPSRVAAARAKARALLAKSFQKGWFVAVVEFVKLGISKLGQP